MLAVCDWVLSSFWNINKSIPVVKDKWIVLSACVVHNFFDQNEINNEKENIYYFVS